MRVITGTARGRRLKEPQGMDIRPTTDKVKESMFSILQFDIEGRRVLDLFGGTGQLGIEALSRGASEVVFVDKSAAALKLIRENLELCGLSDRARVRNGDSLAYLRSGEKFDLKKVHDKARAICEKYEFALDLDQKVYEMSVSQKQTLEIVKVLYRGADILILDEPTAVLTPQETEKLFSVIRNMKADGKAVIIITHKLHEVLSISDRVAILRKGEYVGDIATKDANEAKLTEMMVGEKVELNIERPEPANPVKRLDIEHLTVRSAEGITVLDDASFPVYGGEILGIAGISGNGQKELLEAIAGLQPAESGASIEYYAPDAAAPVQLVGKSPKAIREAGIHLSFVPEDRLGMGLVGSMGMTDNMMLKSYGKGHSPIVDRKAPLALAETIKKELGVVTPDLNTPVSRLSGGNVQKVLVGRELAADPIVLMTAYAVRGLDINTSYTIYHLLNEQKKRGVAVIYVGEDLDVLLELCDRIVVLCGGKVNGILDGRKTTKEEVGLRMTNLVKEEQA